MTDFDLAGWRKRDQDDCLRADDIGTCLDEIECLERELREIQEVAGVWFARYHAAHKLSGRSVDDHRLAQYITELQESDVASRQQVQKLDNTCAEWMQLYLEVGELIVAVKAQARARRLEGDDARRAYQTAQQRVRTLELQIVKLDDERDALQERVDAALEAGKPPAGDRGPAIYRILRGKTES